MFKLENVKYKNIIDIENLEIKTGIVTSISGESGAGKSTLLKLLNKMLSPDFGKIYYQNKDLSQLDSVSFRREIPTLSQFPVIFDGNIRDNLKLGLKLSKKNPKSDEDLLKILHMVKLDKKLNDDPRKLSGGEKQRLCIARILLMETKAFMLDEPSASLDSKTEYEIIKLIYEYVKKTNKTMIYITHNNYIAEEFSDVLINLKQGKVDHIIDWKNQR
ncbi:MAG: ABC transporter ATP-binding protein [Peptoniphilaceae bacterium]|nr:ABC transporter ATP-binding protein [Peptoniphilaceae bacterium]